MEPDQRHSRRLPPGEGRDSAVIRLKGQEEGALIVNLSAEGLRVCTFPDFSVEIGDVIRLETNDGHHQARVMNLERLEDRLFIGLERLHDAPLTPPGKSIRDALRQNKPARMEMDVSTIIAYVILPIAIGMTLLFVVVGWDGIKEIYHAVQRHLPK